jgi:hypothetical protein
VFIDGLLDDLKLTEILRNSLYTSGTAISAEDRSKLAHLVSKWGDVVRMRNTSILNIDDAIDVCSRLRKAMTENIDWIPKIQKDVAVIQSDTSLGGVSGTIREIVSSGLVSINSSTVKAANSLEAVLDAIDLLFPNVRFEGDDIDPLCEYFHHVDIVYKEFSAALHPYRTLKFKMFESEGRSHATAIGLPIFNDFGTVYAGTAIAGSYSLSSNKIIQASNLNTGTSTVPVLVNNSSFIQVNGFPGTMPSYFIVGHGFATEPATGSFLPVMLVEPKTNDGNLSLTISCTRDDSHGYESVTDGAGAGNPIVNNGGVTAMNVRLIRAGVTVNTISVTFSANGETKWVHFEDVRQKDVVAASLVSDNIVKPPTGSYAVPRVEFNVVSATFGGLLNAGRIVDLVRSASADNRYAASVFDTTVQIGMQEIRLINEYLKKKTSSSLTSSINSYYQSEKSSTDTLTTLGDECLSISWWLTTTSGITPDTKGKVYEYFYETCKDHLNVARANYEFCKFALNG